MKMEKKVKCAAKTKEGKLCKNSATGKSKFCATHKKKQFVNYKIILAGIQEARKPIKKGLDSKPFFIGQ